MSEAICPKIVGPEFPAQWIEDLSDEDYHADKTAVSSTPLKTILRSGELFYTGFVAGVHQEETPALKLGKIVHAALLEPKKLAANLVQIPEFKGKGSRSEKAEWLASLPVGAMPVKEVDYIRVEGMINSVLRHRDVSALLKHGTPEISGYYRDPETGIKCRIRPDHFNDELMTLIDIKTTVDCSMSEFSKSIWNYRYDFQIAMYCAGIEQIMGRKVNYPIYIAIEKKPPYEVALYVADEGILRKGNEDYRRALDKLRTCLLTNTWPTFQPGLETISLPKWATKNEEIYE